ncbi:hypothetical protein ACJZ2D_007509 [Fusarium nematophilum]
MWSAPNLLATALEVYRLAPVNTMPFGSMSWAFPISVLPAQAAEVVALAKIPVPGKPAQKESAFFFRDRLDP